MNMQLFRIKKNLDIFEKSNKSSTEAFLDKEQAQISLPYNKIGLIVWSKMCKLIWILGLREIML